MLSREELDKVVSEELEFSNLSMVAKSHLEALVNITQLTQTLADNDTEILMLQSDIAKKDGIIKAMVDCDNTILAEKEIGGLRDIGNRLMEASFNEWSNGKWSVICPPEIVAELKQALAELEVKNV
jgi:hypothetical protein